MYIISFISKIGTSSIQESCFFSHGNIRLSVDALVRISKSKTDRASIELNTWLFLGVVCGTYYGVKHLLWREQLAQKTPTTLMEEKTSKLNKLFKSKKHKENFLSCFCFAKEKHFFFHFFLSFLSEWEAGLKSSLEKLSILIV